jgi:hypothetical protein
MTHRPWFMITLLIVCFSLVWLLVWLTDRSLLVRFTS